MKSVVAFAALLVLTAAQQYYDPELHDALNKPEDSEFVSSDWLFRPESRQRRDVTFEHKTGPDGKVFGTLGQNDNGLFGKGGYKQNIFNDHRGKLDAQAYGQRTLGAYGDTSHLGGALNWKNDNAAASLDVSKQIHGHSTIDAAAGGRWQTGRNSDLTAQGFYSKTPYGRDHGGRLNWNYRF